MRKLLSGTLIRLRGAQVNFPHTPSPASSDRISTQATSGIFVYEQNGALAGLEVYGLTGEAPKVLPSPESLRPIPK